MSDARWSDRRIVLWMGAVILLLIVVVSVLAPNTTDDDARPTTYNAGPQGAKAAFLMLEAVDVFADHLILHERADALPRLHILQGSTSVARCGWHLVMPPASLLKMQHFGKNEP